MLNVGIIRNAHVLIRISAEILLFLQENFRYFLILHRIAGIVQVIG